MYAISRQSARESGPIWHARTRVRMLAYEESLQANHEVAWVSNVRHAAELQLAQRDPAQLLWEAPRSHSLLETRLS